MAKKYKIDYDGKPIPLVREAFAYAREYQQTRYDQWKDDYKLFNAITETTNRDPERANVFSPKIKAIIKSKVPAEERATLGSRPYLPFDSRQREYRQSMKAWEDYIDDILDRGGWFMHSDLRILLKMTYGIAYQAFYPWFEEQIDGSYRLRIKLRTRAPWEVFVHPKTTSLEEPGGCPYLIDVIPARKRDIKKMIARGEYEGVDPGELDRINQIPKESGVGADGTRWGDDILDDVGLSQAANDDDFGVVYLYRSEERKIDVWNGQLVLKDIPNDFGFIEYSRHVHDIDAHTKNAFFGVGEVKPLEIDQILYNDLLNRAIDAFNRISQPTVYHDGRAIPAERIVYGMGNKIQVDRRDDNNPLSHYFHESPGNELPRSHFEMLQLTREDMDMTAQNWQPNRGEPMERQPLATELVQTERIGNENQEMTIRRGEEGFQRDFLDKLIKTVAPVANMYDLQESVGPKRAMIAMLLRPDMVPGGVRHKFKGSSRVSKMRIAQTIWAQQILPFLRANPGFRQDILIRGTLERFEEDTPEMLEGIIPDEIAQMMALMQQAQQAGVKEIAGGMNPELNHAQKEARIARKAG